MKAPKQPNAFTMAVSGKELRSKLRATIHKPPAPSKKVREVVARNVSDTMTHYHYTQMMEIMGLKNPTKADSARFKQIWLDACGIHFEWFDRKGIKGKSVPQYFLKVECTEAFQKFYETEVIKKY